MRMWSYNPRARRHGIAFQHHSSLEAPVMGQDARMVGSPPRDRMHCPLQQPAAKLPLVHCAAQLSPAPSICQSDRAPHGPSKDHEEPSGEPASVTLRGAGSSDGHPSRRRPMSIGGMILMNKDTESSRWSLILPFYSASSILSSRGVWADPGYRRRQLSNWIAACSRSPRATRISMRRASRSSVITPRG